MNKNQVKKLASRVAKSSSQKAAILSYLTEGNEISACGAVDAGIADPRRVVNLLRGEGHAITRNVVVERKASKIVYALAPAKKSKKKSAK